MMRGGAAAVDAALTAAETGFDEGGWVGGGARVRGGRQGGEQEAGQGITTLTAAETGFDEGEGGG